MPDPLVTALPHIAADALATMVPPASTALIVVDIQVDFAAPHGLLGRVGVDLSAAEAAIDRIEALIPVARQAGVTLGFMRVVTMPQTDSNALKTYMARTGQSGGEAICRAEGGGADYYRLAPEPGDITIDKLLFDSFHGTDLEAQLRARGIDTLVVTGLSTDCCVDATVRAAFHRDFHVFIATDACAAYAPDMHSGPLSIMAKNCAILTTSDDLAALWGA